MNVIYQKSKIYFLLNLIKMFCKFCLEFYVIHVFDTNSYDYYICISTTCRDLNIYHKLIVTCDILIILRACLHIPSPCPCPSKSPSKFNIVLMVTETVTVIKGDGYDSCMCMSDRPLSINTTCFRKLKPKARAWNENFVATRHQ